MYFFFLGLHNVMRWMVLLGLLAPILASIQGRIGKRSFGRVDALLLKLANGFTHTQLLLGLVLYFAFSPLTLQFFGSGVDVSLAGIFENQMLFFALYHSVMMFVSVVVMSIGGSLARRATEDAQKFNIIARFYGIALLLVLAAIPWFRPLPAQF